MRAYLVVLALLATPLAVVASQTPTLPGNSSCDNGNGTLMRSDSGTANAHQGLCQLPPPPPPPPPPSTCGQLPATGGATVTGQVSNAADFSALQGWCVDLTGTDAAGNAISGSILTDALGNFAFSVPGGTYTVCEVIPSGWSQTFPPAPQGGAVCPQGFGYQSTVMVGGSADFNNFGNVFVGP